MPEQTSNGFNELITDLHLYNTPNTVMTDAINATVTTDGENQFILQNMKSNEWVAQLTSIPLPTDPTGPNVSFKPLGIAIHKNIAYIISAQFDANGDFVQGEIGTYPSPNWTALNAPMVAQTGSLNPVAPSNLSQSFVPLLNVYSPLANFLDGTLTTGSLGLEIDNYLIVHSLPNNPANRDIAYAAILSSDVFYTNDFRSSNFKFQQDRLIEIELQESYDNSINIIFTDDYNKMRLINSRFILGEDGKSASLANRRQTKDTNTYSDVRFFANNLLRTSDKIADLNFKSVSDGGQLPCGNYKVYLKYSDTDGALSDLIEESRLISVGVGNKGGTSTEISNKYIHLTLDNLDYKFSSVKIYYSYFTGDTDSVGVLKEINNIYSIPSSGRMDLFIYGNETTIDIDPSSFNLDYSSINSVKTFTQHDDRLVDGNISNFNSELDRLKKISQQIAIKCVDTQMTIKKSTEGYADPANVYNMLGLWAGETYEIGICYILTGGRGVTPVFPIRGIDDFEENVGANNYTVDSSGQYEEINSLDGYYDGSTILGKSKKENRLGVYRTPKKRDMLIGGVLSIRTGSQLLGNSTNVRNLAFDTKVLYDQTINNIHATFISENVEGFFMVRKERKRDCIAQGYITNANKVYLYPYVNPDSAEEFYFNREFMMPYGPPSGGVGAGASHLQTTLDPNDPITLWEDSGSPGKFVPNPGQLTEFALTTKDGLITAGPMGSIGTSKRWHGTTNQADNPRVFNTHGKNKQNMYSDANGKIVDSRFVFYTPDMLVDAPYIASLFNNTKKGMMINNSPIVMGSILDPTKVQSVPYGTNYFSSEVLKVLELNDNSFDPVLQDSFGYGQNMSDNYFQYINEYKDAYVKDQFSAISNRNTYCWISRVFSAGSISGLSYTAGYGVMDTAGLGVDSVRYSDYIGIKCVARDPNRLLPGTPGYASSAPDILMNVVGKPLNGVDPAYDKLSSYAGIPKTYLLSPSLSASELWIERFQFQGINFGMQTNVYNSDFGAIAASSLSNSDWKNKYSNSNNSESYYAFSKRIPLEWFRNGTSPSYTAPGTYPYWGIFGLNIKGGGDCFINYVYKRAWYSHGVDGFPTASDPSAYQENNLDTGLIERGLVFPMVCESNYNISMRSTQFKDEIERSLYGQDRSFYPLDDINHLRGSRQLESKGYNFGYNDNNSIKNFLALDDALPALGLSYDTRILISSPSISGSFVNGYTDFSGLNFRDYAKNLGQINKVISHNGTLFCIQENGVSVVPMNQRTMVSEQQGGVFLDDGQLLGQKLLYISTEYGSDQQFSVGKSDNYIYGCTFDKNKIWRIENQEGSGKTLKTISDFKIQKILNEFKNRCVKNIEDAAIYSPGSNIKPFVKMNYDRRTNTVIFTYFCLEKSVFSTDSNMNNSLVDRITSIGSVYFNESTGKWGSRLSWDPLFMFNLGSSVYSFNSKDDQGKIWKHFSDSATRCNFYGKQEKFEFEFVIVEDSTRQKILNNMLVVCNREFPGRLTLMVDDDVNLETPNTWNQTPGIGSTTGPNIISTTQLMRQRHEDFQYTILGSIIGGTLGTLELLFEMSREEAERLNGGWFKYGGNVYVFGNISTTVAGPNQLYIEILNQNLNIVTSIPSGISISVINFGILKQNMDYIEDHLYIEISKNKENSRIRDKYIKVRFSYEGMDYITIQRIISSFDYSFS